MKNTDIAIIGIAGRFPMAKNHNEFWKNIENGKNGIRFFSDEELRTAGVDTAQLQNKNYVKAKGVVEDIELFDASFFGFTPREAEVLSPQHRLALECSFEALEHGGYGNDGHEELTGVYMGAGMNTYLLHHIMPRKEEVIQRIGQYKAMIYSMNDSIATLISYKLNLKGPAVNINTACSTSLVSVHYACQGLQTYECDKALAGGVCISTPQQTGYLHEQGSILSPDGHCRAFDSESQGVVPGAGVGVVLLKRLADAIEDNDTIYAVIEGTAINNDGSEKAGFTAPSIEGQSGVIIDAQLMADVHPDTIDYVEAHGTGTAIGDPIEIAALTQAFRLNTSRTSYCAIGSVKTNIGHLDAAAGVASLIKTTLSLKNERIPPSLHYRQANPLIDFKKSPFYVNTALKDWKTNGSPRRAGVSSFGIGGTNAHLILREAPEPSRYPSKRAYQIVTLSAKSESSLHQMLKNLIEEVEKKNDGDIPDVGYTLNLGRKTYPYKAFVVCRDKAGLIEDLKSKAEKSVIQQTIEDPKVVFLCSKSYSGEKHRWIQLLYDSEPVFKQNMNKGAKHVEKLLQIDLRDHRFDLSKGDSGSTDAEGDLIANTLLLYMAELSMARLWMSWGLQPNLLLAHGAGRYTAAAIADVFTMEEGLDLLYASSLPKDTERMGDRLKSIQLKPSKIRLFSATYGGDIPNDELRDMDFWTKEATTPAKEGQRAAQGLFLENEGGVLALGFGKRDEASSNTESIKDPLRKEQADIRSLYETLGELWSENKDIDWEGFYAGEKRNRIPLPTYPWEKTYHWIDIDAGTTIENTPKPSSINSTPTKNTQVSEWFYEPVWIEKALLEPNRGKTADLSTCLFFTDEASINKKILKSMAAKGDTVVVVQVGTEFVKVSDLEYKIDPYEASDYDRLIQESIKSNLVPNHILHAWNLSQSHEKIDELSLSESLHLGFYSLNFLAKSIHEHLGTAQVLINVLSKGVHRVDKKERISPSKATLLGALKVIPQEFPTINCRSIDITALSQQHGKTGISIRPLVDELYRSEGKETCIAYRSGKRWVQEYKQKNIREESLKKETLKHGGIYMITGGLGGVGLNIAEYLAEQTQGTILLVNRSGFPDKGDWDTSLDISAPVKRKIERLRKMETGKATVLTYQADVSDEKQMRALITMIREKWGRLNGVVHAAALTGKDSFVPIKDIDRENSRKQFQAKIQGTNVLLSVLEKVELDFCVAFSSLSSVLGGLGFSTYAAANNYLDALVQKQHNSDKNSHWISVNWDSLQHEENLNGAVPVPKLGASMLEVSLSPKETTAAFERAMALIGKVPQIIVTASDLQSRIDQWIGGHPLPTALPSGKNEAVVKGRGAINSLMDIEQWLIAQWEQAIGTDNISREDDFFELGGDSLLAITMLTNINETFGTELSPSILMTTTTVAGLAETIGIRKENRPSPPPEGRIADLSIVKIQEGNPSKTPLILVHPVGGQVFFYQDLAKELPGDQPIYGYRAAGLEQGEEPIGKIEVMAKKYVEDLLLFQDRESYLLGGASLGGMIAYEMAQQLTALGKKVDLVALIDTPMAQDMPQKMESDANILFYMIDSLVEKVPFTLDHLEKLPPSERLTFAVENLKKALMEKSMEDQNHMLNEAQLDRVISVFKANTHAFYEYSPQPYNGRMVFFRALERRKNYDPDHPELPWIALAKRGIEIQVVPGDHLSMNLRPNVASIAEKMNELIRDER